MPESHNNPVYAIKSGPMLTYLERWGDPFRDYQTTFCSALGIILHNCIAGYPNTIGVVRGVGGIQWLSAVAGQRRMDDTMFEGDVSIGDRQWFEKIRVFAAQVVDGHVCSFLFYVALLWNEL